MMNTLLNQQQKLNELDVQEPMAALQQAEQQQKFIEDAE